METKKLFSIKNLKCSYNKKNIVLNVDNLDLYAGELIFLIGESGSGKSTFLETVGLMNNTLYSGEITFFPDKKDSIYEEVQFHKLWLNNKQNEISEIRKDHFSFIFQYTNLMENFTAYENVCMSRMIQDGEGLNETQTLARKKMREVKLPETEVSQKTLAANLSGGQRQRIAFVRALISDFLVLFCDEPTGNLDEENAKELMSVLKSNIEEKQNSSAIIVSHDIDLALKYADRIIVITKNNGIGVIDNANIFEKKDWLKLNKKELEKYKDKLISRIKSNNANKLLGNNCDVQESESDQCKYKSLFYRKEGIALTGKRFFNIIMLNLILSITFLALGFANGNLEYLKNKMDSAFVNWLAITIPYGKTNQIDNLKHKINTDSLKTQFGYQRVDSYVEYSLLLWNFNEKEFKRFQGRSVELNEEKNLLLNDILQPKNLLKGNRMGFANNEDLSVIVTQEMLHRLHYPDDAAFVYMGYDNGTKFSKVPIPIRAIVKEIPGKNHFISTLFFNQAHDQINENTFDVNNHHNVVLFTNGSKDYANQIKKIIEDFLRKNDKYLPYDPIVDPPKKYNEAHTEGRTITISFDPQLNKIQEEVFLSQIKALTSLKSHNNTITRIYNFSDFVPQFQDVSYDVLSIHFSSLDKIREFSGFLYTHFNKNSERDLIEVDMGKVIEKENFNFLNKISTIISYLLIIFSVTSVCLFISSFLNSHLNKVKMNLGTLRAFGLDTMGIQNIYMKIIATFIFLSICSSIFIAYVFGVMTDKVLVEILQVEEGVSYFNIYSVNTIVGTTILLTTSLLISYKTISKILQKTPGDLIYNR